MKINTKARRIALAIVDVLIGWGKWHVLALALILLAVLVYGAQPVAAGYSLMHAHTYTQEQLDEVRSYVTAVVVLGRSADWVADQGLPAVAAPDARMADYCGRSIRTPLGCTVRTTIYLAGGARQDVLDHELAHLRDVLFEGKTWAETAAHEGWAVNLRGGL